MSHQKKTSLTQSAGTKLTPEQHATLEAQAAVEGLAVSEFVRRTLLSAISCPHNATAAEILLRTQSEELQALRLIIVNLGGIQANGALLTPELLEAIRAYADQHKAERVQRLLTLAAHDRTPLATENTEKEAI